MRIPPYLLPTRNPSSPPWFLVLSRSLALQYRDLLSKSEDLQGGITAGTEEDEECTQYGDQELDHEFTVVPGPGAGSMASWRLCAKPLIPGLDEV
jgi:hypothetical protein